MLTPKGVVERVYSDGAGGDNPYDKPRLKMTPTRLFVSVESATSRSASPSGSDSSGSEPTGAVLRPPGLGAAPQTIKVC